MSVLVAGGGFARGRVIGSSNAKGETPRDTPVTPADLLVTLYRQMGLDPGTSFPNRAGRPISIGSTGRAIDDLGGTAPAARRV